MNLGDKISLRGNEWTIVGVFAGVNSLSGSAVRADAGDRDVGLRAHHVSAGEPAARVAGRYPRFKDAVTTNPAISVDVKTLAQNFNDGFGQLNRLLDFVAYFVGSVMASGAIFGALNSLYASVDARRRELATLRAIGFNSRPIVLSVLVEGMLLALPGAFLGAAIAWFLYNGDAVNMGGLIFKLSVTPHLLHLRDLLGAAHRLDRRLAARVRAARLPVATALRPT